MQTIEEKRAKQREANHRHMEKIRSDPELLKRYREYRVEYNRMRKNIPECRLMDTISRKKRVERNREQIMAYQKEYRRKKKEERRKEEMRENGTDSQGTVAVC